MRSSIQSELLADKLAVNLPSFSIHKETVRPDEWSLWLEENCKSHGFQWNSSPLIWRELTERGGRGALLGGKLWVTVTNVTTVQ